MFRWRVMHAVAMAVVVVSVAGLASGWGLCVFGTSDDGLHCVPAVLATVVAGPLAVVGALGAWVTARRARTDRP